MEPICICGHVKACHVTKCCAKCVEWEEQDLVLRTLTRIIQGFGIKARYVNDRVVIENGMLRLLRGTILNLHRENQKLRLENQSKHE